MRKAKFGYCPVCNRPLIYTKKYNSYYCNSCKCHFEGPSLNDKKINSNNLLER